MTSKNMQKLGIPPHTNAGVVLTAVIRKLLVDAPLFCSPVSSNYNKLIDNDI